MKLRVLFLCTHNSCRSQMAEGLLRLRYGGTYEVFSAGTQPTSVHPLVVQVMDEINVDLSSHTSENLASYVGQPFDAVVTTCDSANESCPVFPGAKRLIHHGFRDPSDVVGSDELMLNAFRATRDEIDSWIQGTFHPRTFAAQ